MAETQSEAFPAGIGRIQWPALTARCVTVRERQSFVVRGAVHAHQGCAVTGVVREHEGFVVGGAIHAPQGCAIRQPENVVLRLLYTPQAFCQSTSFAVPTTPRVG